MKVPWHRWHPEVALRYLPVVKEITKAGAASILEVGSGSLGIAPYIKRQVTGVDLSFEGPAVEWLTRVEADARSLPFDDASFDAVVSVDLLEHIPPADRGKVVAECVRVARKLTVLAAPVGKEAALEDSVLAQYYQRQFGTLHPNFKDHLKYDLPSAGELCDWLQTSTSQYKKRVRIHTYPNESVWLHRFLMRGWMTRSFLVDLFFRKMLLPFIPFLSRINGQPAYRMIAVARYTL